MKQDKSNFWEIKVNEISNNQTGTSLKQSRHLVNKIKRGQKRFLNICVLSAMWTKIMSISNVELQRFLQTFSVHDTWASLQSDWLSLFSPIFYARINCPYLLSCICFYLPTRRTRALHNEKVPTLLHKHDCISLTLTIANSLDGSDFFDRSLSKTVISFSIIRP